MEIWKAVSSRFILKDKTFTILLILIMELGYPRKRWVNRKEIVLARRRENDAPCGRKDLPGGSGEGENYKD